jgi:hypothetical protein
MPHLSRPTLLFLVVFWMNGISVIRAFHTGWVFGVSNDANAHNLLRPLCTKDVSESYTINSLNRATIQLEARFLRCSIWTIFLVSSLSQRQYCSHENLR